MSEYGSKGLREEDVRRIIRDETRRRGEAPPRAAPVADPTPVGLAGFALTTFLFSIINAGWLDQIGTFIPQAFFYGGLVQLLAGMWEFRNNNTFGAVVFTSYGAFWGAFGFFFFSADSLGVLADVGASVGFTLLGWTVFTSYVCIASIKVNKATFIIFTAFTITLILLDLGFLLAVQGLVVAGGYAGIILAICAWYTSAAGVLNHTFGRIILPLGSPFQLPTPGPAPTTPERTTESTAPVTITEETTTPGTITEPTTPEPAKEPTTLEQTAESITPESPTAPEPQEQPTTPERVTAVQPTQPRPAAVAPATTSTQPQERVSEEVGEVLDQESRRERREELRRIIRESVRRSEVGGRKEPQVGTITPEETRADDEGLPIEDYDSLNIGQVTKRLARLSVEEIERLRDYEARNQNRQPFIARLTRTIRAARKEGTTKRPKGAPEKT